MWLSDGVVGMIEATDVQLKRVWFRLKDYQERIVVVVDERRISDAPSPYLIY
jgi:hypothetical protein